MNSPDGFELKPLANIRYLFTRYEHTKLLKHGALASRLDCGDSSPRTGRQVQFVKVCNGEEKPASDFDFLWLRYKETIKADEDITRL